MLAAFPASLVAAANPPVRKTRPLPNVGEFFRFADPTTENSVVRLTNPSTTSLLPAATNRFISAKDRFLIFSSDRTGRPTPFHLDLRTGAVTPIIHTTALQTDSLCLDERQKVLYLLDGASLKEITLSSKRMRVLADDVTAFSAGSSSDLVLIRRGRLEQLKRCLVDSHLAEDVATWCLVRPGGKGCLFGRQVSDGRARVLVRSARYSECAQAENRCCLPKDESRIRSGRLMDNRCCCCAMFQPGMSCFPRSTKSFQRPESSSALSLPASSQLSLPTGWIGVCRRQPQ